MSSRGSRSRKAHGRRGRREPEDSSDEPDGRGIVPRFLEQCKEVGSSGGRSQGKGRKDLYFKNTDLLLFILVVSFTTQEDALISALARLGSTP